MADLETGSMKVIDSLQSWEQALPEIKAYVICGLEMRTTGPDPLTQKLQLVLLSLPGELIYIADLADLEGKVPDDLVTLLEDSSIKKIVHDSRATLSFIRVAQRRRLKFKSIFDLMLAPQLCWSGTYDLAPSNSSKNPWKKRVPDHSLEALAERHLGIPLEKWYRDSNGVTTGLTTNQIAYLAKRAQVLLPLHVIFQELIEKNCLEKVAELEFRTLSPVIEMEILGIHFDSDAARTLIREKEARLVELFGELQSEAKANGYHPPARREKHEILP